jgi:hypothetical protein
MSRAGRVFLPKAEKSEASFEKNFSLGPKRCFGGKFSEPSMGRASVNNFPGVF